MEKIFTVPCPPFDLKLSHWDRLFPPTHSKRILCFSLPLNANKQRLVDYLQVAFHQTIQHVPFLAGSIVPFPAKEGGRPWLRNLAPIGAATLHIKDYSDKLSSDELAKSNFSQHLLKTEELCPLPEVGYFGEDAVDVCQFQANFIEGGLLLVVSIIHIAADGRGVTEVIKIFADELRKAQSGGLGQPLEEKKTLYVSDRTLLVSGNGVPGDIERHAAWTSSPLNAHGSIANVEDSCVTFRISARALSDLKDAVSALSRGPDDWYSTNDAVSALIWRSIMAARHRAGILAADAITHVAQPLDCRAHLGLPEPYFGNVLYMTKASAPLSVIADGEGGLYAAARVVRAEIKAMTADKFRDLVGYAERTEQEYHTRLNIIEDLPTGGIILTSHFKFDLHGMDFGPAFGHHMKALRLPARGTMAGAVIVMPRLPDGSCEFMVTEQENTIRCLMEDKFFGRFTRDEDAVNGHVGEDPTLSPHLASNGDVKVPNGVPKAVNVEVQAVDGKVKALPGGETGALPIIPRVSAATAIPPSLDVQKTKTLETLLVRNIRAPHVGAIKIIQLHRPKAKNAISRQMVQELGREIEEIHNERAVGGTRALIIASAVDDVFCAGADLKERKGMGPAETQAWLTSLRAVFSKLAALPIPSIACVSGAALGGGLELALCCHLRVFSSNAVVGLPETKLAIIPGAGGTYRLPRIVGLSHALDLVLTGRKVQAHEAAAMGLCNRLVAADQDGAPLSPERKRDLALDNSIVLAQEICKGGPFAVRAALSALAYSCEAVENAAYESVLMTKDRGEALQAFGEKREAIFRGE